MGMGMDDAHVNSLAGKETVHWVACCELVTLSRAELVG
jgi:hypothetical protein